MRFPPMFIPLAVGLAACGRSDGGTPTRVPRSNEGQMFLLGQELARAALTNGRAAPEVVERAFDRARTIARITLEVTLTPLPIPSGDHVADGAEGLGYLMKGPGSDLVGVIDSTFGKSAVAAYELAVKLNAMPMLYAGDGSMGGAFVETISRLGQQLELPVHVLAPLVAQLEAHASHREITDLVFEIDDAILAAIAARYERGRRTARGTGPTAPPAPAGQVWKEVERFGVKVLVPGDATVEEDDDNVHVGNGRFKLNLFAVDAQAPRSAAAQRMSLEAEPGFVKIVRSERRDRTWRFDYMLAGGKFGTMQRIVIGGRALDCGVHKVDMDVMVAVANACTSVTER